MNINRSELLKSLSVPYFASVLKQNIKYLLVFCALILLSSNQTFAQEESLSKQTLPAIVVGTDTIAFVYLNEVLIYENLTPAQRRRLNRQAKRQERRQERDEAAYAKLRYNVYKVYPYANTAAFLLKDVHEKLAKIPDENGKKKYLKNIEKELNKRFKGELEEFTISQGIVLVKLINRQTGRSCFDIIQEVKGGFNAVVWQGVALVFSNNLKREYEPAGRDKDIEGIVLELEATLRARAVKKT